MDRKPKKYQKDYNRDQSHSFNERDSNSEDYYRLGQQNPTYSSPFSSSSLTSDPLFDFEGNAAQYRLPFSPLPEYTDDDGDDLSHSHIYQPFPDVETSPYVESGELGASSSTGTSEYGAAGGGSQEPPKRRRQPKATGPEREAKSKEYKKEAAKRYRMKEKSDMKSLQEAYDSERKRQLFLQETLSRLEITKDGWKKRFDRREKPTD